jgi:hypothetical protein
MPVEEAVEAAGGITHLEVFLQDYPQMLCLEFFPALTSLVLIQVVGGEARRA